MNLKTNPITKLKISAIKISAIKPNHKKRDGSTYPLP
jgi:hypothetical protein